MYTTKTILEIIQPVLGAFISSNPKIRVIMFDKIQFNLIGSGATTFRADYKFDDVVSSMANYKMPVEISFRTRDSGPNLGYILINDKAEVKKMFGEVPSYEKEYEELIEKLNDDIVAAIATSHDLCSNPSSMSFK